MRGVILAAGYGTRLQRDLCNDDSGQFKHLLGLPKALLPIGPDQDPLITHWVRALQANKSVTSIIIVTNSSNHEAFLEWGKDFPDVQLLCEGSTCNDNRRGAVACMQFAAESVKEPDDMMVIGGDTLFYDGFSLGEILADFEGFKSRDSAASMVLYVTCTDEEVHKYGILETDAMSKVTGFLEKPQPTETSSRKECPCFYIFNQKNIHLLGKFLEDRKDAPMKARDATGNFVSVLLSRNPVYAREIDGRFDVGGLDSYLVCNGYFFEKHGQIDFS
ncbi:hypothetical protein CAPTEDRAFT_126692 [Capitella teleta]|uniref:Nucleotidyl transferase domain-containing protein n=1 Tax=Capitella teleta TaxID=283909 RepID=R7UCG0_CAPTE|nr:hypothetical protein CAPTEDRAFT_126692 [Capitella teleta]|eukprot:ELU04065.1 hypothetical protein CAPTEDRAFT_126692 [Capitella teleta]